MVTMDVQEDLAELPAVRHWANGILAEATLSEPENWQVVILLDELVANAISHGSPPITVTLTVLPDAVRGEVADGSNYLPAVGHAGSDQAGGRGMELVEKLAARWGTLIANHGKTVWFEVAPGHNANLNRPT